MPALCSADSAGRSVAAAASLARGQAADAALDALRAASRRGHPGSNGWRGRALTNDVGPADLGVLDELDLVSGAGTRAARRVGILVAAVLLLLFASSALALSCAPKRDRYVFSCAAQRCDAGFRIDEVPAFATCSRRPVVEDVDPGVARFLAPLIEARVDGVYVIELSVSYWRKDDGTLASFLASLKDTIVPWGERERTDLTRLTPDEIRTLLSKRYQMSWIRKEDASRTIEDARRDVEGQARRDRATTILLWFVYWASFAAVLVWLVHSVHVYFRRLYAPPEPSRNRRLAAPVAVQLVIAGLGVAGCFVGPSHFWPGVLLLPGIVVVLLAEGWARCRAREAPCRDGSG